MKNANKAASHKPGGWLTGGNDQMGGDCAAPALREIPFRPLPHTKKLTTALVRRGCRSRHGRRRQCRSRERKRAPRKNPGQKAEEESEPGKPLAVRADVVGRGEQQTSQQHGPDQARRAAERYAPQQPKSQRQQEQAKEEFFVNARPKVSGQRAQRAGQV